MTRSMIKTGFATAALLAAVGVQATTVAHWDFETDLLNGTAVDDQGVTHSTWDAATNPYSWEGALEDVSGNGNHLSVFTAADQFGGMQFETGNPALPGGFGVGRATLSDDPPASACCPGAFTDGDLQVGGNNVGSLANWTIETSVRFTDVGGWQTMVGMDGIGSGFQLASDADGNYTGGADGNQANLYLQKSGADGTFRINFVDADGYAHIISGTTVAEQLEWYHVAATSDGSTLRLFVNGVEEATLDMTASGSFDTSLVAIDESGTENDGGVVPHAWSLARGMYNNGHGDRVLGVMDDTRISDVALDPSAFLITDFGGGVIGDTDGDGDIDDFDLLNAISNFTGSLTAGTGGKGVPEGDTDDDADVDDFDLLTMISGFTGSLSAPQVPEPGSIALLSLGTLALLRRRRA